MLSICRKMTVVFLLRLARFCANSVASRPESFEVDEAETGSIRQSCRARETGGILTLIFRTDGLPMLLRLLGQQFGAITIIPVHPKPATLRFVCLNEPGIMTAQEVLQQISGYCRHTGLAESTFGRRAVFAATQAKTHAEVHHPQMSTATSIAGMSQSGRRASRLRAPHHRAYEGKARRAWPGRGWGMQRPDLPFNPPALAAE
jgi:hypothetical protein